MAEEDFIAGLTRQVKEEVVENYLTERRLIELQIEDIGKMAENLRFSAAKTGKRLNRIALLMVEAELIDRFATLAGIPRSSYWGGCLQPSLSRGIRLIRVRALTDRGKYRKIVMEAYHRLHQWMDKYRKAFELLRSECEAVNINIRNFQKNFDLLAITSFLRSMDIAGTERRYFLGENFTAEEVSSIDRKLHFNLISFDKLDVTPPLSLADPLKIETPLLDLASEVYRRHQSTVKRLLQ